MDSLVSDPTDCQSFPRPALVTRIGRGTTYRNCRLRIVHSWRIHFDLASQTNIVTVGIGSAMQRLSLEPLGENCTVTEVNADHHLCQNTELSRQSTTSYPTCCTVRPTERLSAYELHQPTSSLQATVDIFGRFALHFHREYFHARGANVTPAKRVKIY